MNRLDRHCWWLKPEGMPKHLFNVKTTWERADFFTVHWMAVKGSSAFFILEKTLMLEHVNGSSNPLHWFNLTRSLHDLLALSQISSYQTTYLWLPGSHSLACPAPSRPSSVIICTTLAQIPPFPDTHWLPPRPPRGQSPAHLLFSNGNHFSLRLPAASQSLHSTNLPAASS